MLILFSLINIDLIIKNLLKNLIIILKKIINLVKDLFLI